MKEMFLRLNSKEYFRANFMQRLYWEAIRSEAITYAKATGRKIIKIEDIFMPGQSWATDSLVTVKVAFVKELNLVLIKIEHTVILPSVFDFIETKTRYVEERFFIEADLSMLNESVDTCQITNPNYLLN